MSQQRSIVAPNPSGLENSAANPVRIADSFELVSAQRCTSSLAREIADFLDSQNTSHPYQLPQWAGEKAYLALYRRQGKLCWFAQCGVFYPASRVVRAIRAFSVGHGPVADDLEVMEAGLRNLVDAAKGNGIAFVEITPEWSDAYADAVKCVLEHDGWRSRDEARMSLRLGLGEEPERLLASFRKVTRYEIRRCEKLGLELSWERTEEHYQDWLRLYRGMAREKHFEPEDCAHILQVLRWLSEEPDRGGLLLARKDSRLVGGIVVIRVGRRCWYVLGATAKEDKFSPGHLLQWRAIQWAKEMGCSEYDLGGYREGTGSGTAFFKRGFCDNVVKFPPASRYIVSPARQRTSEIIRRMRNGLLQFGKS